MSFAATAIAGGAAIGAGGSILSSIFGAQAQMKSTKYTADKMQQTAYELDARQRADLSPFRQYGITAGNTLMSMLSGEADPSALLKMSALYKFQSDLGQRDITRALAARGLNYSGAGMETLQRFTNQLVGEEGERYYNRLFNLTTLGENAAARMGTNTVALGGQLMSGQAQLGMQQANIQGQLYGNIGSTLRGIGQDIAQYPSYKAGLDYMNSMNGGNSGGGMAGMSQYGPYASGYKFDLGITGT